MKRQQGFSLLEVVMFLVLVSIMMASVFMAFDQAMSSSPSNSQSAQSIFIAEQRMDLIVGQRLKNGFSGFVDPCVSLFPSPATDSICSKNAFAFGYTVSSTITPNWNSNADITKITVTVTGPSSMTLTTLVGND